MTATEQICAGTGLAVQEYDCCCCTALVKALTPQHRSQKYRLKCEDATEPVRAGPAVDRCEGSFGTRRADASLLWLRARGLPAKHKRQAHRSTARRESTGSFRGVVFAAAAQRKSHSAPRRRIEKRRNSHSALSSLCSTNSQELCSEAARALADPALTPSTRQARSALQDTVITGASRAAADEP